MTSIDIMYGKTCIQFLWQFKVRSYYSRSVEATYHDMLRPSNLIRVVETFARNPVVYTDSLKIALFHKRFHHSLRTTLCGSCPLRPVASHRSCLAHCVAFYSLHNKVRPVVQWPNRSSILRNTLIMLISLRLRYNREGRFDFVSFLAYYYIQIRPRLQKSKFTQIAPKLCSLSFRK
jgi:hypothetical protein